MRGFFSGTVEPFWPHAVLLTVAIAASFAVAAGIVLENPKWSLANLLVIGGVAIEAACTLLLFGFDEGISGRQQASIVGQQISILLQQDSIIALTKLNAELSTKEQETEVAVGKANERAAQLEKEAAVARVQIADANAKAAEASQHEAEAELELARLKQPRTLGPVRQKQVADAIRAFAGQQYVVALSQAADDGLAFWESLYATLTDAGWVYVPPGPGAITMGRPPVGIPIVAIPGLEILFNPANEAKMTPAALALGNAIHADGTVVAVNRDNVKNPAETPDVILIRIGARVPPP